MFTRVAAGYGEPPNTLTDPVVLALPGALPVMNKAALDQIIRVGLMLGCEIAPVCKWDRKNYFYPDSPKNYQISQYDQPICVGGSVEIELPGPSRNVLGEHKRVPLTRVHLEEDVGKLNHADHESLVDFNRAGTPLMEIVSEPALHSAEEAFAYLTALKMVMVYGGISDCDMEKGQMRCDANVSIRPAGAAGLGTKVELKNLNSISFVRDGIAHEIRRQVALVEGGGTVVQETRDYDGQTGTSQSLRSKEMAHDYRYFPDPDLMPVKVDAAWKARCKRVSPSCRSRSSAGSSRNTSCRTRSPPCSSRTAGFATISRRPRSSAGRPQAAANWIANDLLRELAAAGHRAGRQPRASGPRRRPGEARRGRRHFQQPRQGGLRRDVPDGRTARGAWWSAGASASPPTPASSRRGAPRPSPPTRGRWTDFRAGKENAINALKGFVMKQSKGKANPRSWSTRSSGRKLAAGR